MVDGCPVSLTKKNSNVFGEDISGIGRFQTSGIPEVGAVSCKVL